MKKGFFLICLLMTWSLSLLAQEIKNVNFVQEGEVSKLIIETDKDDIFAERFHVSEDKQIILDLKIRSLLELTMNKSRGTFHFYHRK